MGEATERPLQALTFVVGGRWLHTLHVEQAVGAGVCFQAVQVAEGVLGGARCFIPMGIIKATGHGPETGHQHSGKTLAHRHPAQTGQQFPASWECVSARCGEAAMLASGRPLISLKKSACV